MPYSPTTSTLFPYTTLFRSHEEVAVRIGFLYEIAGADLVEQGTLRKFEIILSVYFDRLTNDPAEGQRIAVAISLLSVRRERSEEHTSELQSQSNLVCRLLLE